MGRVSPRWRWHDGVSRPASRKICIALWTGQGDNTFMDTSNISDQTAEVTPAQLRAARALLGWSREHAALECGVGWATLGRLERDERSPRSSTLDGIVRTFEGHGVRFFRNEFGACVAIADGQVG